jgi:hypothetical protein
LQLARAPLLVPDQNFRKFFGKFEGAAHFQFPELY